jgi:hypothetical protein
LIGAGTVINPIIKIVTTVAIVAAIGIFIVRPVLDTTEDAIDKAGRFADETSASVNASVSNAQIDSMRTQIAARITSLASTWPEAARALRNCARDAGRDALRLERCESLARRVSSMQSDRNFSTSYATALRAQGEEAAAARIEDCVDKAGFDPGPMGHCRELADQLLFG